MRTVQHKKTKGYSEGFCDTDVAQIGFRINKVQNISSSIAALCFSINRQKKMKVSECIFSRIAASSAAEDNHCSSCVKSVM